MPQTDPFEEYRRRFGGDSDADPFASYSQRYGGSEPEKPSLVSRVVGRAERFVRGAQNVTKQAGLGVVDSFGRAAEGVTRLGNAALPGQPLGHPDEVRTFYRNVSESTAPTTGAGAAGRIAGNIVGEGLQYIGGGGAVRRVATPVLARTAPRVAARVGARLGGMRGGEVIKDAIAAAPVDALMSAVGPDNSTAGMLADVSAPGRSIPTRARPPFEDAGREAAFQEWYRGKAQAYGIDPNPDNPRHQYDYRRAFEAQADAKVIPEDGLPHWPSEFKLRGHPNLIVDGRFTPTGEGVGGGLAHRFLRGVAANPVTRFASEAATGVVGDVGLRGIGWALRRADPARGLGDMVSRAVMEGAEPPRQAWEPASRPTPEPPFLHDPRTVDLPEPSMDPRRLEPDDFDTLRRPGPIEPIVPRRTVDEPVGPRLSVASEEPFVPTSPLEIAEPGPSPSRAVPFSQAVSRKGGVRRVLSRTDRASLEEQAGSGFPGHVVDTPTRLELAEPVVTPRPSVPRADPRPLDQIASTGLTDNTVLSDVVEDIPGGLLVRGRMSHAAAEEGQRNLAALARPGHAYRGMTAEEFAETVGAGRGVMSRQDFSVPGEGTSFGRIEDAEDYANVGRSDPARTGQPTFLVEVGLADDLTPTRDGYFTAARPIPQERVTRVWRMEGRGEDVVAMPESLVAQGTPSPPITTPPVTRSQQRTDLFGEEVEPTVGQGDFLPEPDIQGISRATDEAQATVSLLEGRVRSGDASVGELERYDEARSLLRREGGLGLDTEEVSARATGEGVQPDDTGDLLLSLPEPTETLSVARARGAERRAGYRATYRALSDEDLISRWAKLQRGLGKVTTDFERIVDQRAAVSPANTPGELIKGTRLKGRFETGRMTQQTERIAAVETLLRERGIEPRAVADPFRDVRPQDVMEENRELVRGGRLAKLSDDDLASEIRAATGDYNRKRTDVATSQRMTLLWAEATKPNRNQDLQELFGDMGGFALPDFVRALTGGTVGAVGGAGVGATIDDENRGRGALLGAAVGGVVGARVMLGRSAANSSALQDRYLQDPSIRSIVGTMGAAPKAAIVKKGAWDRVKALGGWLRYKVARESLPMESLERSLTGGASTRLRDEAARARGWVPSANLHAEETFRPVLQASQGIEKLVGALGKAERGLELARFGKDTSPQQVADWTDVVAKLGAIPEVRAAVDQLRSYYRALLDMKLDAGVITKDQYDAIVDRGEHYVPFLPSDVAEFVPTGSGPGRYAPNRTAGVRRMSDALNEAVTVDPLDQAIVDTYETFDRVARQRVANAIGDLVAQHPAQAAGFVSELPARWVGTGTARHQTTRPVRPPTDGRVVEALVNGERRYFIVHDEDLFQSWTNFNKPLRSTALKAMNGMRQVMQAGVTGNPVFGLVNGIRDFMQSAVQYPMRGGITSTAVGAGVGASIAEPGERLEGAVRGAVAGAGLRGGAHLTQHLGRTISAMNDILGPQVLGSVVGGTAGYLSADQDQSGFLRFLAGAGIGAGAGRLSRAAGVTGNRAVYDEFVREGGAGFGFYARNQQDAQRMRAALLKEGVSASDILNPRSWWDAVQHVSRAIETAPRLAKYKQLRKAGSATGPAIFEARDLSLDFAVRPGSQLMRGVTQTVPFMNPAIQGMDKLARMLTNPKVAGTAAATIIAPTVTLWAMIHEDPETAAEYQSRPLHERNSYWLIPKKWFGGETGFLRSPKPFELGFIYASLPERLLDYVRSENPEQLQFALRDMYGQYGPGNVGGVPMPFGPLYDVTRGEHGFDPFRRREINPDPWSNIPPELQSDDRTSTLGVALGQATGTSPAKWDYAIRGYTGTLGSEALAATSAAARALGIDNRPAPAGESRAFAGRFHTDPSVTPETEQTIRRQWDTAEKAYNGLKETYDRDGADEAREYAQDNRDALVAYQRLKPTMRVVRTVSEARRRIREHPSLTPEQKANALAKLNTRLASRLSGEAVPAGR